MCEWSLGIISFMVLSNVALHPGCNLPVDSFFFVVETQWTQACFPTIDSGLGYQNNQATVHPAFFAALYQAENPLIQWVQDDDDDDDDDVPVMEKSGDKKKVATKGKSKNNTYR